MLKNKKILYAAAGICVILAGIFYYVGRNGGNVGTAYDNKQPETVTVTAAWQDETVTLADICVYVCGQVNSPGIYYIGAGLRVADAIEAAGGITEDAYVEALNLAENVSDGQRIYVPAENETTGSPADSQSGRTSLININTADASELVTLPGIGESRALSIIAYREENGAYSKIEDIMNVSGIKEAAFSKIKDRICV